jgi:hypothetical protein
LSFVDVFAAAQPCAAHAAAVKDMSEAAFDDRACAWLPYLHLIATDCGFEALGRGARLLADANSRKQ